MLALTVFTTRTCPNVLQDVLQWQDARRCAMAQNIIEYARPGDDVCLCFDGQELVGLALLSLDQESMDQTSSEVVYLAGIATKRPGIGREFLLEICNYVKECGFEGLVVTALSGTQPFYEKCGMRQLGARTFYITF
jgi:hypothetical protein